MITCRKIEPGKLKWIRSYQPKILSTYQTRLQLYSTETTGVEGGPKKVTFRDKIRETWYGPNFKYWFIGTTAFLSWMTYYGLKSYKKTRILIDVKPAIANHSIVERQKEVEDILEKYKSQNGLFGFGGEKLKALLIHGPPASGKTTFVNELVKVLLSEHNGSKYSIPKSNVSVFLQCDSEDSFLTSLKVIAAKLKIKLLELEEELEPDMVFSTSSFDVQCHALLTCIQDALKKHPGWIFVFDNIQSTSPRLIAKIIDDWFINGDKTQSWSKGNVILVYEGAAGNFWNLKKDKKYQMRRGLSKEDSCELVKKLVNIDELMAHSQVIQSFTEKVFRNPLGVACLSILLLEKLKQKEVVSIENAVKQISEEIKLNVESVLSGNQHLAEFTRTSSGHTLLTLETVVAMTTKSLLAQDSHLYHGFDLISTLKPGIPSPQSLVARHLMLPFYQLPPLNTSSGDLTEFFSKQKSDLETVRNKVDEFEPKGKAWSNKNLAEYVRKVEEFFMTGVSTVKEIYNMVYGELPPLPEKQDGLSMFRECQLLSTSSLEPGGAKAISMHPIVYNAVRQHLLSSTVHQLEANHLLRSQNYYNNQPWYKKLSGFSEQTCLQKYRLSAGHTTPVVGTDESYLLRYNLGINISSIFEPKLSSNLDGDFWVPKACDQLRYLQSHLERVVTTLCEEIQVSKEDAAGRSSKKNLLTHLEYILNTHPKELFGTTVYTEGLQMLTTCYIELYKDFTRSKQILEDILVLQKSQNTTNPLDIAKTLTKLAEIENSNGDYESTKSLLEEAAELYEADRRKYGEYKRCTEFGKLLGLLGVVYASLGKKVESKETIERSLMLKQAITPDLADEAKSKRFGSEFASSLTDLGHSYVSLGLPLYGKKILDLALSAHKNLHGENHPEVIRTLTVLAISHLMQGHNEESKKLRREAGKLQAALNAMPIY